MRGDTHLDGETLAIWPRDEVRGAWLRRRVELSDIPALDLDVGAEAGCAWQLNIFVNDDKVFDRLQPA